MYCVWVLAKSNSSFDAGYVWTKVDKQFDSDGASALVRRLAALEIEAQILPEGVEPSGKLLKAKLRNGARARCAD